VSHPSANVTHASSESTVRQVSDWKRFFQGFKLPHPPGKPDKMLPLGHRIAFLLDWAAKKAPYNFVPYNVVYKEINGLEATPRTTNEDVTRMRRLLTSVRPLLQRTYKRDIKNLSGFGVRATVDDLDVVKTTTGAAVRRFNSAGEALKKNAALVNPSKLPEGSDKAWFTRTVSPAVNALSNDPRMLKLLPPGPIMTSKSNGSESR
jgi:hypothetical protein